MCPDPLGHLQATGRDARGRKQFVYHPEWRRARDQCKFDRMVAFGESLPRVRRGLRRDLARHGMPREKVLALIVALLDVTRLRIGNGQYVRENESFGLTTLRNRHARFIGDRLRLTFRGKGGVHHDLSIDDRRLVGIARRCHQLPGQPLFQYLDESGASHRVDSGMVNEYIGRLTGQDFTAKDFRTWGATLQAISLMARTALPEPATERACGNCICATLREVSRELRNTPAVCRKSYVNPAVFEGWRDGSLHRVVRDNVERGTRAIEKIALSFLRLRHGWKAARSAASVRGRRPAAPSLRAVGRAGWRPLPRASTAGAANARPPG